MYNLKNEIKENRNKPKMTVEVNGQAGLHPRFLQLEANLRLRVAVSKGYRRTVASFTIFLLPLCYYVLMYWIYFHAK
jgi:hypothetical protein